MTPLALLEEYSAAHPERVDELGNWTVTRFERAWMAFQERKALETLDLDQRAMTAAFYANSGMDDAAREKTLERMRDTFMEKRASIIGATRTYLRGDDPVEDLEGDTDLETEVWW